MFSRYTVSIGTLIFAMWAIPLARAILYLFEAGQAVGATSSNDAANDLRYATWLLLCYLASLILSFVCVGVFFRPPRISLLLPAGLLIFAAIEVVGLRPEEPIVFIPALDPLRPVCIVLIAIAIAASLRYFRHKLQPKQTA